MPGGKIVKGKWEKRGKMLPRRADRFVRYGQNGKKEEGKEEKYGGRGQCEPYIS